jgi:hypothetical protein
MATVKTYDPRCYELAEVFLADLPKFNNETFKKLLALEIQQVIKDEISFMEAGYYTAKGTLILRARQPSERSDG